MARLVRYQDDNPDREPVLAIGDVAIVAYDLEPESGQYRGLSIVLSSRSENHVLRLSRQEAERIRHSLARYLAQNDPEPEGDSR